MNATLSDASRKLCRPVQGHRFDVKMQCVLRESVGERAAHLVAVVSKCGCEG